MYYDTLVVMRHTFTPHQSVMCVLLDGKKQKGRPKALSAPFIFLAGEGHSLTFPLTAFPMEKFRTFEDPATGIMPFMPHKVVVPKNSFVRLVRALFGLALLLVRLPLLLIATSAFAILSTLVDFVPLSVIRRPMVRLVDGLCCRMLLLVLGFFWIPAGYAKKRTVTVANAVCAFARARADECVCMRARAPVRTCRRPSMRMTLHTGRLTHVP